VAGATRAARPAPSAARCCATPPSHGRCGGGERLAGAGASRRHGAARAVAIPHTVAAERRSSAAGRPGPPQAPRLPPWPEKRWGWAGPQPGVRAWSASLPQEPRHCSSPAGATGLRHGQLRAPRGDHHQRIPHHGRGRSPRRRDGPAARLRSCPPRGRAAGQRQHGVPGRRGPCRSVGRASRPSRPLQARAAPCRASQARHGGRGAAGWRRSRACRSVRPGARRPCRYCRRQSVCEAAGRTATGGRQPDVVLQAAQARCPLGIRPCGSGQALGEDAMRAAGPPATRPAHLHLDLHAAALPGQVRQPTRVAAVQP